MSILNLLEDKIKSETFEIPETPYVFNGAYVPRVTSILSSMLHEDYLMDWANAMGWKRTNHKEFTAQAATKGSFVHDSIEKYIQNNELPDYDNIDSKYRAEVTNAFNAFLKWWEVINTGNIVKVLMEETPLICPYFGGTLDLLLDINGKIYLFDFKTSKYISYKYFLQLSAYRYVLKLNYNIDIDGCGTIKLDKQEPVFVETLLPFSDPYCLSFINQCQETFLSLVYGYYNRLKVESMYNEIMKKY